jgi:hypothetical protein
MGDDSDSDDQPQQTIKNPFKISKPKPKKEPKAEEQG